MGVLKIFGSVARRCRSFRDAPPGSRPSAAARKTVFDPLTQQLDRARDVQKTVDQSADKTRAAVDSQERGDCSP